MSASTRTLRWRTDLGDEAGRFGLEHVEVKTSDGGIAAEGVAIDGDGDDAFGARWRITVDPEWACVRSLHLTRLGGPTVALRHDGYGEWSDGEGKKRKDFAGLTDCLIEGSPFGLGAVVARLAKKAEKAQTFDVILVTLPGLEPARVSLGLKPLGGGRFTVTLAGTESEAEVDGDGAVRRWGARRRIDAPAAAAA